MMKAPRVLLLQARLPGDPMAAHELRCFAAAAELPGDALLPVDLLGGVPGEADLRRCDAVFIGGSGDFSVLGDQPFIGAFIDFLRGLLDRDDVPVFGSCFGFQALVLAGGGEVVHDPARSEVGTFLITLNAEGANDPLLGPIAPAFQAQLGHKDRAARLPPRFIHLGHSERVPYQIFRDRQAPIFATQFHPELDMAANKLRYLRYLEGYQREGPDLPEDDVLATLRETPEATALLRRWMIEVLG